MGKECTTKNGRRATSTSKVELKRNYLIDVYLIVKMEEIPDSLIINWDQTINLRHWARSDGDCSN